MKKKIIILVIASMVLGLVFTGCSKNEVNTETEPNSEATEVDNTNEDSDKTSDKGNKMKEVTRDDLAVMAKYKVKHITDENTDNGTYRLSYISEEKLGDLFKYFDDLLKETSGYTTKEIPNKMGYIKGTINGDEITVGLEYNEDSKETKVDFFTLGK